MPSGAQAMSLAAPPAAPPPTGPPLAGSAPPAAPGFAPPQGAGGSSATARPPGESALTPNLRTAIMAAQGILWATCVMVIILGGVLFMITMLGAKTKAEQADSAQVSAALFIGAYALARAGERACLLLESHLSRRRR